MTIGTFPILTADGKIKYDRIDPTLLESLRPLPLQHDRYFVIGTATICVSVSKLVLGHARPEGIANANILMREAAAGQRSRRVPIRVRELGDGRWYVVDGNSTAMNALFSGWPNIPADIDHF